MKVRLSFKARSDLRGIFERIAADDPNRALSFARELRTKCDDLSDRPAAFPVLASRPQSGLRRRVHGKYLIFYRIGTTDIEIVRILHGAMDHERLLFPEA